MGASNILYIGTTSAILLLFPKASPMTRTAFDLRKSTFCVCPSLLLMYALWDLSQVYSLMLTVSQSCEDSVTDNYSARGSGWVLWPESLRYGIAEGGLAAPVPRECYIQYGERDRTGFDPVGATLAFHPCSECQKLQRLHYCTK